MVVGKTMTIVGITLLICIVDQVVGLNCNCGNGTVPLYDGAVSSFNFGCDNCGNDCGGNVTSACYTCCSCCRTDSNATYYVTNYGTESSGFTIEAGDSCPEIIIATTPGGHGGD